MELQAGCPLGRFAMLAGSIVRRVLAGDGRGVLRRGHRKRPQLEHHPDRGLSCSRNQLPRRIAIAGPELWCYHMNPRGACRSSLQSPMVIPEKYGVPLGVRCPTLSFGRRCDNRGWDERLGLGAALSFATYWTCAAGLVVVLGSTIACSPSGMPSPADCQSKIRDGWEFERLGKHSDALVLYSEYVEALPALPVGYEHKGLLLLKMGRFEEAAACLEELIARFPQHAGRSQDYMNLARAYLGARKYKQALVACDHSLSRMESGARQEYPAWRRHLYRGLACLGLGRPSDALESAMIARGLSPDDSPKFLVARCLHAMGQHEKARLELQGAFGPSSVLWHFDLVDLDDVLLPGK